MSIWLTGWDYVAFALAALLVFALMHAVLRWLAKRGLQPTVWFLVVVVLMAGWVFVEDASTRERDILRSGMQNMAPTFVEEMRQLGHEKVTLETDWDDPVYLACVDAEKRWLRVNTNIADIYTFIRDEKGSIRLLVDSETDYDRNGKIEGDREQRTQIGEVYQGDSETMADILTAFNGTSALSAQPSSDKWGTWVSSVTPMRDKFGRVYAVLGIDFPAGQWLTNVAAARQTAMLFLGVLLAVLGGGAAVIVYLQMTLHERQTATEMAKAREEAAKVGDQAKSDFLANMSHEIRTPMTAIMGYIDLIQSGDIGEEEKAEHLKTITRNGEHLLAIINDILDVSAIDAGKLKIKLLWASPAQVVEDVVALLDMKARSKGIDLVVDLKMPFPKTIETDPIRLRQVLVNLVGNAIKFTQTGSVTLRAEFKDGPNAFMQFQVVDTGCGIADDQLARLFAPFTQADNSMSRQFGGTGLGLAISRRLARLLGGDVSATSVLGNGSTFTARVGVGHRKRVQLVSDLSELTCPLLKPSIVNAAQLPKMIAEPTGFVNVSKTELSPIAPVIPLPAPAPAAAPTAAAGDKGRILLVEDGIDNQRLISLLLKKTGANVTIANNGEEGLNAVLAARTGGSPFDLVFMDMQMPVMDGYTAVSKLREAGVKTPIVALTAHAMTGDREKCLNSGCDDYMTKPADRALLAKTCEKYLAARADKGPFSHAA